MKKICSKVDQRRRGGRNNVSDRGGAGEGRRGDMGTRRKGKEDLQTDWKRRKQNIRGMKTNKIDTPLRGKKKKRELR